MAVTNSNISLSVPRFKNPTFIKIMRVLWWVIALMGIILFLLLAPINFEIYATQPARTGSDATTDLLYADAFIEGLTTLHIAPSVYATIKMATKLIIMLVFYGISYLIFRARFEERIGMHTAFCFIALGAFLASASNVEEITSLPAIINTMLSLFFWAIALIGWGGLFLFLPLYPDGKIQPRWLLLSPLIWVLSFFIPESLFNQIDPFIILGTFGIPLAAQIYRYFRLFNPLQRQQTKWLIYTVALFVVIIVIQVALPPIDLNQAISVVLFDVSDILINLFFVLFPLVVGLAILRYRLWDIDLIINKSLVYGAVVILAIGIFFLTSTVIQVIFSNQQIWIALIFSLIVSAAIFNPVSKRVQTLVDRYIYRLRFDLNELGRAQQAPTITNPGMLTGQQFGDYEVGGVIGKGGMGEVYDGFGLGQRVAIKTMLPEIAKDPDLKTRFEREVEIGLSLKNPHIAQVYSQGEHNGTPYLVMEYVGGQDLSHALKGDGQFDTETAIQIIKDVCSALSLAHEKGYVHRDLKPSNIMLRENGSAVLMDFGISKIQDAKTITGTGAIGTIQYMAPEQIISSKDVDHRADIYALGCVLYQMLTGETPFSGGAAQVMFAQIQQTAPDPRDIQDDIPKNIAEAILKAMEKEPEKRFNSVEAFARVLSA
ncbi:MAG: serine/threonine-protein kinase [Phototrophicaceae bacterium]